jgi:hypothetical protein
VETACAGGLFADYLGYFETLIGDKRTAVTFGEIVKGIIGAGSLVCSEIAAHSGILSLAKDGGQRVRRFATGESTERSQVDADSLTARLRSRAVEQLSQADTDVWLILDGSDLRKPYAHRMPDLMKVRALDGRLVPGYRTLTVLGVTPGRRGILYHRVFSSQEQEFESEPAEVQQALQTVGQALAEIKSRHGVTWIVDRGFDDQAVWRTIWEQGEHVVCRICHPERLVEYQDEAGAWVPGDIQQAKRGLRLLATARTEMKACLGRQQTPKLQPATVEIRACPLQVTYETNVRREGRGQLARKAVWLVEVRVLHSALEPWLLLTDWPVTDAESAVLVFRMYRQRWAVEDSFKFTKECLDWEEVQLLNLNGIRALVALSWIAAGFLYELGVTLEWAEVTLLARLGGWEGRPDRPPGKIALTRGLRRLCTMYATEKFLDDYVAEHGALPPRIAAFIGRSPKQL